MKFIDREGLKRSDAVIAVSSDLAAKTCTEWSFVKHVIDVQPNAVPALPPVKAETTTGIRKSLGREDKTVLCFAGALKPIKRLDVLLTALPLMKAKRQVSALIVGAGPELPRLQEIAKETGVSDRVRFVGWQKDPYPYMAAADAVILCSDYEGSPLMLLEALGLGVPVLGSRVGGVPDTIGDDRLMFKPSDPEDLARTVLACLDDEGNIHEDLRLVCKARVKLLTFDWPGAMYNRIKRLSGN